MPQPPEWSLIVCGGGSGGHLFPALAVIEELRQRESAPQRIIFLTADRTIDEQIIAGAGAEHISLKTPAGSDFRRRPLSALFELRRAYRRAADSLRHLGPAVILGTGGFSSIPGVFAGWRKRYPIVLLEQNLVPGRATSLLYRLASQVCVSFEETRRWLRGGRVVHTGNPVRPWFVKQSGTSGTRLKTNKVIILGGSQGTAALNQALIDILMSDAEPIRQWEIFHQTGIRDEDRVAAAYRQPGVRATVAAFFQDPDLLYGDAALAVSRAGATTLAELACCGIPAVLIPYPRSARDHQAENARWYESRGAARVVWQRAGWEAELRSELHSLMRDPSQRESLGREMQKAALPHAAARVADVLIDVLKTRWVTGEGA